MTVDVRLSGRQSNVAKTLEFYKSHILPSNMPEGNEGM